MDIEAIIDERVVPSDLESARRQYLEQQKRGQPSALAAFTCAHALIRSSNSDARDGIKILEQLLRRETEDIPKRDVVYYLAVAHTRIKEYDQALTYVNLLLSAESSNRQAADLKALIEKRMKRDGLLGMMILGFGGGAAVIAGLTAAVIARSRH